MSKFFIITLLFSSLINFSQQSKSAYISDYSLNEKVIDFKSNYDLSFKDTRKYHKNKIDLEPLENYINGFYDVFEKPINFENLKISKLVNKKIKIEVDFLNFVESSAKKTILKGILKIEIDGGSFANINKTFSLTSEEFSELKFKNIHKVKYFDSIEQLVSNFSKKFAKKIISKIKEVIKDEDSKVFEVITIGFARLDKKLDKEKAKKKAILNGLVKASEIAFGTEISNTTNMEDFGNVSDILKTETGAIVLNYIIMENSLKYTSDNYCCILIKSIIKKK